MRDDVIWRHPLRTLWSFLRRKIVAHIAHNSISSIPQPSFNLRTYKRSPHFTLSSYPTDLAVSGPAGACWSPPEFESKKYGWFGRSQSCKTNVKRVVWMCRSWNNDSNGISHVIGKSLMCTNESNKKYSRNRHFFAGWELRLCKDDNDVVIWRHCAFCKCVTRDTQHWNAYPSITQLPFA